MGADRRRHRHRQRGRARARAVAVVVVEAQPTPLKPTDRASDRVAQQHRQRVAHRPRLDYQRVEIRQPTGGGRTRVASVNNVERQTESVQDLENQAQLGCRLAGLELVHPLARNGPRAAT